MIRRVCFWLGVLSLLVLPAGAQEARTEKPREWRQPGAPPVFTGEVTVAFWNVEWFPGGQSSRQQLPASHVANHIAAVAEILNAENPAILIAAEVRDLESALALNRALKQPYPFVAMTDYGDVNSPGKEGKFNYQEHALFSRIPWTKVWEVDFGALPVTPTRPARGFIGATFVLGKQPLTVYGVHPKSNFIRQGQKEPELTALRNTEKRERATDYCSKTCADANSIRSKTESSLPATSTPTRMPNDFKATNRSKRFCRLDSSMLSTTSPPNSA